MSRLLIKGGWVIDPSQKIERLQDVLIVDGVFSNAKPDGTEQVIDVSGKVVCPGLIDIHVHLREPGQSSKETIRTGTMSAAAGGFTSVVCMPNTSPAADGVNTIAWIKQRAAETGVVNVFPTGCISKGREGQVLAPIGSLKKAGVVAITDDGDCIQSNELMRRALEYCKMCDITVMDHCQDYSLVGKGVMNEGYWSTVLGLKGWPAIGEEIIVARNVLLAEFTGAKVHCQHLSSEGSVRILREAKQRGVPISGEVCPHHIALTDRSIDGYNTNYKMNPPLRTRRDIEGLLQGIQDGTIEILSSDHAPHCSYEKEVEFDDAPFGIVGLETEVGIFMSHLVHGRVITLTDMIRMFTLNPANLLGLDRGTLKEGRPGDVTILSPDLEWVVDKEQFYSLSRNTPFHGTELKGRAIATIVNGKLVWSLDRGFAAL